MHPWFFLGVHIVNDHKGWFSFKFTPYACDVTDKNICGICDVFNSDGKVPDEVPAYNFLVVGVWWVYNHALCHEEVLVPLYSPKG